jgi:hypothetical protein
MKFYGIEESVCAWRQIIVEVLNKECSEVFKDGVIRYYFEVDMNEEDLDFLQKNYWYEKQVGQDLPWNWRIAFQE